MSSYDRYATTASPKRLSRNALIAGGVVLLHVAALWAFQSGLAHKVVAAIVPPQAIAYIMAPPAPEVPPPPAPPPPTPVPPTPTPRPAIIKKATPRPAPAPLPVADSAPSPNAPVVAAAEAAPDPTPAAPPAPAAPRIEQPSSNAAYLNNPRPGYPALSRRLREEGQVTLRVLVSPDGQPAQVELRSSSGSERLDRAARDAVARWRFVPARRGDTAIESWVLVPIVFKLQGN